MATKLNTGARAQRKTLITIAEWTEDDEPIREILGVRTEDSTIEFNPDIETSTDILGNTYTDVNRTEPQQDFDPFYLIGGSALGEYLSDAAFANNIGAYNGTFNVYIIEAYKDSGLDPAHAYKCVKHAGCSIIPTSIGGDSYVSMPIEVHFSNKLAVGTVDTLTDAFVFTETETEAE